MDEFMQKKQQSYLGKLKNKNQGETAAYFAKLKENKAIVELPSGLRYEITKAGDGAAPKATEANGRSAGRPRPAPPRMPASTRARSMAWPRSRTTTARRG